MLLPHAALVAVLDGARFELFRNGGTETELKLTQLPTPKLDAHSKESGKRHHLSTANPDAHLAQEDSFVAAVVRYLNHEAIDGNFDHLYVVAAPRALGEIRHHYHVALKEKLVGELAKELTRHTAADIEAELKAAR